MIEEREKTVTFHHSSLEVDQRLDKFLSDHEDVDLSRARIQSLIRDGAITVNGDRKKPSYQLKPGDIITIRYLPREMVLGPSEEVEFELLYEDDSILVVNKPPGLVVHPSAGHNTGTLVHGLLHRCTNLSSLSGPIRPGIVHRLDKDTSGLLVVAKGDRAHRLLADQFKNREVTKRYVALVHGCVGQERGRIDLPISRHPMRRTEMYASVSRGREAVTEWEAVSAFPLGFSLLRVSLHTGRTHQIRVHMAHMGYPVVGDILYGYGKRWWKKQPTPVKKCQALVKRQMLHAELLGFRHPDSLKYITFEAPPPADMASLLQYLTENQYHK
ncbi:MAG TPA: RluA family pseudouridine synthase [Desulfatiglandales bacterium]|nr:RluA family pseudouridine synthase [Desulfatiglandales bacterium]